MPVAGLNWGILDILVGYEKNKQHYSSVVLIQNRKYTDRFSDSILNTSAMWKVDKQSV